MSQDSNSPFLDVLHCFWWCAATLHNQKSLQQTSLSGLGTCHYYSISAFFSINRPHAASLSSFSLGRLKHLDVWKPAANKAEAFLFAQRLFSPRAVLFLDALLTTVTCFRGAGAQSKVREGSRGAGLDCGTNRKPAFCPPAHQRPFPNL